MTLPFLLLISSGVWLIEAGIVFMLGKCAVTLRFKAESLRLEQFLEGLEVILYKILWDGSNIQHRR
ncbi:MAG TPA: hypothetical protein VEC36_00410 [Patescibacteria group bacterium]|nr:hypothetical protein [Patescibacteria group bacterium]